MADVRPVSPIRAGLSRPVFRIGHDVEVGVMKTQAEKPRRLDVGIDIKPDVTETRFKVDQERRRGKDVVPRQTSPNPHPREKQNVRSPVMATF